jgi:sterol desaturase/sphingolipid hydroxylase (fatty acid hydroxylase superfamily)
MIGMTGKEKAFVSMNAILLAIFYTLLGVFVSYILYHLFDEYNEEWQKKQTWYKFVDVSVEISLLSVIAFWSAHLIELAPPVFPVRKQLDVLVDSYISGIFYVFAVFVFMDNLTNKLKFLYEETLAGHFGKIFPQYGSILNLSLSYTPLVKTEKRKD